MKTERTRLARAALLATALFAAACGTSSPQEGAPDDGVPIDAPAPWTDAFIGQATILADVIEIEGPAGIRTHCVARQDSENVDYDLATTDRGLVQTYALKPGAGGAELRAWLDNWNLVALERIVVIELPSRGGEVVVRARGNVFASLPEGETRGASFERRFEIGK
jgi:hypothetical protein